VILIAKKYIEKWLILQELEKPQSKGQIFIHRKSKKQVLFQQPEPTTSVPYVIPRGDRHSLAAFYRSNSAMIFCTPLSLHGGKPVKNSPILFHLNRSCNQDDQRICVLCASSVYNCTYCRPPFSIYGIVGRCKLL
jgi:hypothetical protein